MAIAIAVFAIAHREPYAFLERFHPRHVEIDKRRAWYVRDPETKFKMYVFNPDDASAVLAVLRKELSKANGYSAVDTMGASTAELKELETALRTALTDLAKEQGRNPKASTDIGEQDWSFSRRHSEDSVEFMSGSLATMDKEEYEGKMSSASSLATPSCIVIFTYKETWIDRQLSAIRSWLHIQ